MTSENELKVRMENWRVLWIVSLAGVISFTLFRLNPNSGIPSVIASYWLSFPILLLFLHSSSKWYKLNKQLIKKFRKNEKKR